MALQHLRSGTANKRPIPTAMSDGQLAVNTNLASPGLFFKDSNGDLVKAGPVHVGTTAPNASPASTAATALVANTIYQILTIGTSDFTAVGASANTVGVVFTATGTTTGTGTVSGQQGVEKGEQWLDTTNSLYVMKVYDGTGWRVTDSISLANGSAAAPSLHFGSDTNTGLFRSAADSLAITTAGTQRVTVDSSGRLLLGTTTVGYNTVDNLTIADSGNCGITIRSGTSSASSIYFADGTSGSAEYEGFIDYLHGDNALRFGTGGGQERMRIDSSGTLVIGRTTSSDPNRYVQIHNGSAVSSAYFQSTNVGTGSGAADGIIMGMGDATNAYFWNYEAGALVFATSATEQMRIDSNGKLVVGATSFLSGANSFTQAMISGGDGGLIINSTNTSASSYCRLMFTPNGHITGNEGMIRYNTNDYHMAFWTQGNERMRVTSTGRLGIGTSAPTHTLHVKGDYIRFDSSNAALGTIYIGAETNVNSIYSQDSSGNAEDFRIMNGTETMRIASTGIQIGKTTGSTASGTGLLMYHLAAPYYAANKSASGNHNGIVFYSGSTYVGGLNYSNSATTLVASSDYRLKENIAAIPNAIARAKQLNPIQFNFIAEPDETTEGFLAHEVGEVVPLACFGEKDAVDEDGSIKPQSLSQVSLIPLLTAALKEAIAKIETLETKVAALEAG